MAAAGIDPETSSLVHSTYGRDLRIVIRVLTPAIIAALAFGAFLQYRRANQQVEERFNERQAYLARQAADRLSEVFTEVRKLLVVLAQAIGQQPRDELGLIRRVVDELRTHGAVAAWRQDASGELCARVGADPAALAALAARVPACAPGEVCLQGPLLAPLTSSGRVLVAQLPPSPSFSLAVVLDWGNLQQLIGRITKLSPDSYAWVLDSTGRLIMHPEHREQLGQLATQPDSSCAGCHASFDLHRRMAIGEAGTGRIQVLGGAPKLVAYTPVRAGARVWSLAVATPAGQVTAQERSHLLSVLLFTGAIMLVMICGAVMLDREASRRVRATAAFNRDLAAKVAERTEEIRALYDRLAELQANHTRLERVAVAGEMAAVVAHEIRTPLNALSINAQLISRKLRRGCGEGEREKALEALGTLEREIERINRLLEDHLLSVVRHRPAAQTRSVHLADAVNEMLGFMTPQAARARVEMVTALRADLPAAAADPAKLRQVLLNIVLNAIQAMPDGGTVTISSELDDDGRAALTIRDTGPGVPEAVGADIDQVFRPFVTTKQDGTGLGLSICARLVKEMSGTIQVFSEPGKGASFVIALPLWETVRDEPAARMAVQQKEV
jgi:signal transduction histidine kinase